MAKSINPEGWKDKIDVRGSEECWPWTGYVSPETGYGQAKVGGRKGKVKYVHRMTLEEKLGIELPPEILACHTCDNRPCCNPAHLFPGTYLDNSQDMVIKGRSAKRENHSQAKLSEEFVVQIRSMYESGEWSQRKLGSMFGVHHSTIGYVVRRETWV